MNFLLRHAKMLKVNILLHIKINILVQKRLILIFLYVLKNSLYVFKLKLIFIFNSMIIRIMHSYRFRKSEVAWIISLSFFSLSFSFSFNPRVIACRFASFCHTLPFSIYIFQFINTIIFLSLRKCLLMFFCIICENRWRKYTLIST